MMASSTYLYEKNTKAIAIVAIKERIDITRFAISIIHPPQYYTF